jgi:hypothetical protein
LSQLDGIIGVMYYRLRYPHDSPLIALNQLAERLRVTCLGPPDDLSLVSVAAGFCTQLV